ncbi:MAG: hypothetical protein IAA97_06880 [Spirochaetes bacterium]|uniref:Flavodoxin-like domain-containing protein n=1 Tax=Candidatus Ornithospirochaeta stercoripullorum TaxID=2840899 RepID=A0A9D9H535_9SPIO|nr:hypothetical protein [Candidatus Ornithospirochaeta stercoripullorum]
MQVCIVYAGADRNGAKLKTLSEGFAKGLEAQGHQVDIISAYDEGTRLTLYDYVIMGAEPVSFFSAKIPDAVSKFLAQAGTVSGKRCLAFIPSCLRKGKTLQNLMKAMEREGMILKLSEIIRKPDEAMAIGKRLNVERNN